MANGKVRLGFEAPRNINIVRDELPQSEDEKAAIAAKEEMNG